MTVIGIDLGTTNSVVAAKQAKGINVLSDDLGAALQPSVVSFHPNGRILIGQPAKQRRVIDPQNTIYSVKRIIGRPYSSEAVQYLMPRVAYEIAQGANDQPVIRARGGEFAIPEISAMVLGHMRDMASERLGQDVSSAVITVPANFTDAQRSATATAGAIAGLSVARILNEPTAAAIAYGHTKHLNKTIAVYDFGGGTFDVTIMNVQGNDFQVVATSGDSFLGGDDIDEALVTLMVDRFLQKSRIDLRDNEMSMQRLRAVAEQAKVELSRRKKAVVVVEEIAYGKGGRPVNLELEINRDELVDVCIPIVSKTFDVCQEALRLAGMTPSSINEILLVGGQTNMPLIRKEVAGFFKRVPRADIHPEEAVAKGAALQAAALGQRPVRKRQTVPPPIPAAAKRQTPAVHAAQNVTLPLGLRGRVETERPAVRGGHHDNLEQPASNTNGSTTEGTAVARISPRPSTGVGFDDIKTRPQDRHDEIPDGAVTLPQPSDEHRQRSGRALTAEIELLRGGRKDLTDEDQIDTTPEHEPEKSPSLPVTAEHDDLDESTDVFDYRDLPLGPDAPQKVPTTQEASNAPAPSHQVATLLEQAAPTATGSEEGSPSPLRSRTSTQYPVISEVIPRGLAITTVGGFCEELIARNHQVPTDVMRVFSPSKDGQSVVRIGICQGESNRVKENQTLGELVLTGLPPKPRGQTKIEVEFRVDESGILHVTARDAATGQSQSAHLKVVGSQSLEEFEQARQRFQRLGSAIGSDATT